MTTEPLTDDQLISSVRSALLVAGQEMGKGDQWPVIKDTIHQIMKGWENYKVQRNVNEEVRIHLYAQLDEMDAALRECSSDIQTQFGPKIKEWREICDAYFSDVDRDAVFYDREDAPAYVKRMNMILSTLEDTNDQQ